MSRGFVRAGAGMALGLAVLGGGVGVRQFGIAHVTHYTGEPARTVRCASCHFDARGGTLTDRLLNPTYLSPLGLAVCRDGTRLFATAQGAGSLLEVDVATRQVVAAIPVGPQPHSVVVDATCRTAWVSSLEEDRVGVVDLQRRALAAALPAGLGPAGLALAERRGLLFAANPRGSEISVLDLGAGGARRTLAGGSWPYGAAVTPDGTRVLVASQLAQPTDTGEPPWSEITVVDAGSGRVARRLKLPGAHLLDGIAVTPQGDLALVALVRPRNLIPVMQVERGWVMTNGLGVIEMESGRVVQLPLDEPDRFYADPSGVAVTPDGALAFVSHGGVDAVSVVDLGAVRSLMRRASDAELRSLENRLDASPIYVIRRIGTGSNPRGVAASPDGRSVFVAERLDDRIGVIDVGRLERIGEVDLGGPSHQTLLRRGERLFHSAGHTLQRQFSCRSCHPDNHMDRLQYDFDLDGLGRNLVDNRTLLGLDGTGPFKWNGKNTSLYMQCGIRFARVLMRSEPFAVEDLVALVAYLQSLDPPKNRRRPEGGELTAAQERGREIFERGSRRDGAAIPEANRCPACHRPPLFTDRRSRDVGSASPHDSERAFDTPQLLSLIESAPYLHDGKARTLEEIWTVHSPDDTHGVTSDLGKEGLNDLIEFLKTL